MTAALLQLSGVVVDLLYEIDQVPEVGEEAIVRGFSTVPGGGYNAMIAARRAGQPVSYGGAIGTGPFAQIARAGLEREGIPILRTQDMLRDQGCCSVLIDAQGERTFVASEGAEGYLTDAGLSQIGFSGFGWALLSGYALHYNGSRDAFTRWINTSDQVPKLVFDPSPVVAAIPESARSAVLERAHWISANTREAETLTGLSDPEEAASRLAASRPQGGGVVIRMGADGCVLASGNFVEHIPPYAVRVVDTNGAGDTHVGSFIARMAHGDTAKLAARYANVAAAISTTHKGPATAPSYSEVAQVMNKAEAN